MKRKIILILIVVGFLFWDLNIFRIDYVNASDSIDKVQDKLEDYQDKKEDLEKDLSTSQTQLQKTQAALGTTKNLLQKTTSEISRKEAEIDNLNKQIALNKEILANYLQEAYFLDQDPLVELLVSNENVSSLTDNFDQMIGVKEKVLTLIDDINEAKQNVGKVKEELADKKEDHEKLLSVQQGQQYEIQSDIKEAQATLKDVNDKINKLKSELSSLLSSSVSFDNVIDAAKYASKVTGIRKDYLLGVLVVESNLGRYTGGCTADKSRMSSYRLGLFKEICSDLGYEWKKRKVSCPPSGYKGTGGAMGVAQFMADTWMGYKSSIAAVTGHKNPDPWSLTDGVVAMALKLTKVDGVKDHKKSGEAKAYCVYLAGGNWASYCDSKGVNYGEKVLYWADNYEKLMN